MAAERTFYYRGLRVEVWAKSFRWTGLSHVIFTGSPPSDDMIRAIIDTAQKAGNHFRPEPRGFIARLLARGFRKGGHVPTPPPVVDERVERFFNESQRRPGEHIIHFTGPPVTREMQQLFGGYGGEAHVVGIIQLSTGIRVTYSNGESVLFIPGKARLL